MIEAICVPVSSGADCPCGDSDSGALALALLGGDFGILAFLAAAACGGVLSGTADGSGWSPFTEKVLILRGSPFGIVPLFAA